ncbi:MAG: nitronate monooxygenase [Hyphomicrobiales bacterium]
MNEVKYNTPLTKLLGIEKPIIAGGLMWLSNAEYVSAGAKAGIMSFITSASFPEPDDLKKEIAKCRAMSEGAPFGVNVSMLPELIQDEKTADVFKLIADEGIEFVETSGRSPEAFMPILKAANIKVIHKVPSVRFAKKAQSLGVDMVTIVGAECGGHPGMDMIGSLVNAGLAEQQLDIPFVIGGGIGTGAQLLAALAAGAAGVIIGTRFLVAQEITTHIGFKQALVKATERDTALSMHSLRNTVRSLRNETTDILAKMEATRQDLTIADFMPYVSGKIGRQAYETGDVSKGLLAAGHALGFADEIQPLQEIVNRLMAEATEAYGKFDKLVQD